MVAGSITVLLTGGPGGGKSSALATLRDQLSRRGFQVLVVPETATALLASSGGYDPAWFGTPRHVELQKIFMNFQMQQEDTFRQIASLRPDKPYVIVHDRGLLDGRLFCSDQEWADSLAGLGMTEEGLLKRYDLVIHLTTVASGMDHLYDYGPASSNPARHHTPEEARDADERAQRIYAGHPQVRVVPNFTDFNQKLQVVTRYVLEALHVEGLGEARERVPVHEALESAVSGVGTSWPVPKELYEFQVTFLDSDFTESVHQRKTLPGSQSAPPRAGTALPEQTTVLFEYRKEVRQGERTVCTRRALTEEAYHLLKRRVAEEAVEVRKNSACFIWEGHHYELLNYAGADGERLSNEWTLHGRNVLDMPQGASVPPWLVLADDPPSALDAEVKGNEVRAEPQPEAPRPSPSLSPSPGKKRDLKRQNTCEAASTVKKLRSSASVDDLMSSPALSKAAAGGV